MDLLGWLNTTSLSCSPLPAARRCCHESACRRAKGSTACKSAKGQHRLPRQHQCHEVHRGQEVKQHEQGLHQGHLWQVQIKVGGLHRGPKNGPPTPMYNVCKKNFVSADSLSYESLSLHIFTPKHSKMKFRYIFLKKGPKIKNGCVLIAISCSTLYISDIFFVLAHVRP